MAKNGYDQTYEDDRKENEETRALVKKAVMAPINAVKPKATKPDTGETTNPMGDKYKKGGKVKKMAMGGMGPRPMQAPPVRNMSQLAQRGLPTQAPSRLMPNMGRPTGTGLAGMARPQVAPPAMSGMSGMGMGAMGARPGMKKGGSASSRADGCCIKGKTKA